LSFRSPLNKKPKQNMDREKRKTHLMYSLIRLKTLASCLLVCFAFLPQMHAAPNALPPPIPPVNPDGCYPGFTTAEGCNALANLTSGAGNTGIGWYSLFFAGSSSFSTGVGAGALVLNTADSNTAVGAAAMLLNSTGTENTAMGVDAMVFNATGEFNDAFGGFALFSNTDGFSNNAVGDHALFANIHGAENTAVGDLALSNNDVAGSGMANFNTAVGSEALMANTNGDSNNAVGSDALHVNTTGSFNQAMGFGALGANTTGAANVAIGDSALDSLTGTHSFNTVIGDQAGADLTSGADNIYIGATSAFGVTTESGTIRIGDPTFVGNCYIAGIFGNPTPGGLVYINSSGHLSTTASSRTVKHDIKPMDKASEAIFSLKPVTFRYNSDKTNTPQCGLIAEEVAKVNPDLILINKEGKPYTVRYDQVWNMMLNEFLKEHRTVQDLKATAEKQQATIALQEAQIKSLTASLKEQATQIQKVSAQLETMRPAPQMVENR
jgi:hypothetical protein